jgi:hypothetical protein
MGRDTDGLVQIMVQAKAADSNAEIVAETQSYADLQVVLVCRA